MAYRPEGTLSNRIRELRAERSKMTQERLAELVQASRQTIIAIEAGRYVPSLILAMRIAKALELPIDEVFTLDD